jgi:hypothetical protein
VDRLFKDQRIVLSLGAVTAVVLAVVIALATGGKDKHPPAPPASHSGLQVSVNEAPALNAAKPLRCFVNGQFVGEMTLSQCAQRNGVSAEALDVGADANGALTAAPTASLAPPPAPPAGAESSQTVQAPPPVTPSESSAAPAVADQGPPGACLRFAGSDWRTVSEGVSQSACLKALFAGRCVRPGEAEYGHWGDQTVRLIFPSTVQISSDNRSFHTLYEQGRNCEAGAGR